MKILALDPATHCGWAHSDGASGVWDLSIRRDESTGMRLLRLRGKLNEILKTVGIDLLSFESARNAGPKMQGALVVQAELQGVIKLFCQENHIDFRGFSPTEVKKHATGKGNAGKTQMVKAAQNKWPYLNIEDGDDNRADALHILSLTISAL